MTDRKLRVLIVEDHFVVRFGLVGLLQDEPDIEVVGNAKDGEEGIALFRTHQPDVVILDLKLPGQDGFVVLTTMRGIAPDARVLILSSFDREEDVADAMAAGAMGFVMKEEEGQQLIKAIHTVAAGGKYLSPPLAQRLARRNAEGPSLNARDRKILLLLSKGLTTPEIAESMGLTDGTVRVYASRIYARLGVATRTEAVTTAIDRGLLRRP